MTTRASGPSLLIIEKQQCQWGQLQPAFMSIVTFKQCHHVLSRPHPRWSWGRHAVVNYTEVLLLRTVEVGQAAYVG